VVYSHTFYSLIELNIALTDCISLCQFIVWRYFYHFATYCQQWKLSPNSGIQFLILCAVGYAVFKSCFS